MIPATVQGATKKKGAQPKAANSNFFLASSPQNLFLKAECMVLFAKLLQFEHVRSWVISERTEIIDKTGASDP